ncbi:MAG: type II CAAX endopeptidase family protein [Cyanobacteria bacterium P01_D01_bin.44]
MRLLKLWIRDLGPRLARQTALVRVAVFLGLLVALWAPVALLIYGLGSYLRAEAAASTLALILLYLCFIWLLRRWGREVNRWAHPLSHCGLRGGSGFALSAVQAFAVGACAVFSLFGIEILLGWAALQMPDWPSVVGIAIEGLLVAIGIGFAEELFFRGWLLLELERDYSPSLALLLNALVFAIAHFIKPLTEIIRTSPQFLGLMILGMALVWARRIPKGSRWQRNRTNLGLPIGLHAGLVWGYYLVDVGDLTQLTGRVPAWVTGIDGNPLAGLVGLAMLSLLAAKLAQAAGQNKYA